ncbi:MAG: hypothetical protein U0935_23105 [Pirellulales bacterium]
MSGPLSELVCPGIGGRSADPNDPLAPATAQEFRHVPQDFLGPVLALVLATSAAQAGPPGGTQTFSRFYPANDVGVGSVDLIGGQSTVTVKRVSGVGPVSVRIVGELTVWNTVATVASGW